LDALNKKLARDYTAPFVLELKSSKAGFISRCDARVIGEVIRDLGGGRLTKESTINYDVGIDGLMRPGEAVKRGSILVRIHAAKQADANAAAKKLETAFEISAKKSKTTPLISQMIIG